METTVTVGADRLWAQDSAGPGPTVVLLHSGVGDSRQWDPVWPTLTSSCRVIRYDVQAYGRSPAATQEYTLHGDLQKILDYYQIERAHLAGCSMGGGTAVELALADPGRVQSLTLLCPGLPGYPWPEEPELEAEFEAAEATGDENDLVRFYQRLWAAAGAEPAVLDQLRSAVRAGSNEEKFQQPGAPVFGRLHELRVPTVLMIGDRDRPVLITSNEQAARRIPGGRLIRMPGVDHLPTLRVPDLIAETILAQVRASEPGPTQS
jgi:3-oxoadipate enol-lactonase